MAGGSGSKAYRVHPRAYRSQPLLQEAQKARRQEAGIARLLLLDRIADKVVRRTLNDAGAREEIRLLQFQQERIGLSAPVDQVVLGPDAKQHADLVVGEGRVVDGRSLEIEPRIVHGRSPHEVLDVVLARALQRIALPHRGDIVDAVDAYQRLDLGARTCLRIVGIGVLENGALRSKRGERSKVRAGGCPEQSDALRINLELR